MITERDVSRRTLLKVVGGVGASLVLGCFADACAPFGSKEAAAPFAPSALLRIDPDGKVTITVTRSDMGQGPRTAFAMLVAEELDADWSKVHVEQADANEAIYGGQMTGGSTSVRMNNMKLRQAGAAARAMLVAAAAKTWAVDAGTLKTENGKVLNPANGKALSYGELTAAAALIPVPNPAPKLKEKSEYKIIGKPFSRVDNPIVVTGKAVYGQDAVVPGALFAVVAHSPAIGGSATTVDDSAALKVPGVLHVVNISTGVAVVAKNTWAAIKGREALKVTWSAPADANLSSASIRETLVAAIGNHMAMPADAKKVNATVDFPFLAHAPMEPVNACADVRSGSCEIWVPTQNPGGVQGSAARILGIPKEKVTVHVTLLGGGFGGKANVYYSDEAVEISKAVKQPIKLQWTRDDDIQNDHYRPMSHHSFVGAVDASGMPVGWSHQAAILNSGGSESFGNAGIPYKLPNSGAGHRVANAPVPTGAWRSVEHTQVDVSNEMFFDEIATAGGKDPLELRLQLAGDDRLKHVLQKVRDESGWGKPLPSGHGRGVACFLAYGSCSAFVVELSVEGDKITLHKVTCAVDPGIAINPKGVEAQMHGGCVDALSTALRAAVTVEKGAIVQSNWTDFEWMTMDAMPKIDVHIIEGGTGFGGLGEVGYPPVPAAVANAIFAATGKRVRKFPIKISELATV